MSATEQESTIESLMMPFKGILAADERPESLAKRFARFSIESTPESRRRYRQMLFTTPGLEQYISGMILFDETLRQCDNATMRRRPAAVRRSPR